MTKNCVDDRYSKPYEIFKVFLHFYFLNDIIKKKLILF